MHAAKKAVETIKETAANIGASAKSGLEKTKATLQEKTEMMSAHDQNQKDLATQKKEEKINQAEKEKQQARENNATAKQSAVAGHMGQAHYTNTGPGNETATYDTSGPRPETTSSYSTTGPGPESATYSTTGSGPVTETETATFPTTGPGPETTPHPTGEYGQHLGTAPVHGHGLGHGGLTRDVVGSRSVESNTGVDSTAHITHVGGTAPASGPNFS